ncbi:hypothetical protein L1887_60613 [Cichorium endivia]|nr:hypothetical protein L1887_60613 [Cichorium endivia]
MFSFSNPAATPQQQQQQQQQPQQQQTPVIDAIRRQWICNSFSSPGGFSFGNNSTNAAHLQQQQQQQQQGMPQSGGLFGQKPMFGTPGAQQPTQQQQPSGSLFATLALLRPTRPSQTSSARPRTPTSLAHPPRRAFRSSRKSQNFGQQTSTQSNAFGQGALGFNSSSPAPFSAQPQTQPFSSPMHHHNATQQHGLPHFGTPQSSQQQQQHQQQFQHQQHQQALIEQQRLNLEQQSHNMSYIPGYLSAPSIALAHPPPSRARRRALPRPRDTPSPVGRFSSSFFNERRDDASSVEPAPPRLARPLARAAKRASLVPVAYAVGVSRQHRRLPLPTPAFLAPQRAKRRRSRRLAPSAPTRLRPRHPQPSMWRVALWTRRRTTMLLRKSVLKMRRPQRLTRPCLGTSSTSSGMYSANYRSPAAADATSPQKLLPTRNNLSASSATALQRTSPSLTPAATSSSEGYASTPTGDASAEKNSTLGLAQRTVLVFGYPTWMEKAVLELLRQHWRRRADGGDRSYGQRIGARAGVGAAIGSCTVLLHARPLHRVVPGAACPASQRRGGGRRLYGRRPMGGRQLSSGCAHQRQRCRVPHGRLPLQPHRRDVHKHRPSRSLFLPSMRPRVPVRFLQARSAVRNAPSFGNGKASSSSNIRHSIAFGQGASERANSVWPGSLGKWQHPLRSPFKAASSLFGSGAAGAPKAAPAGSTNAADPKAGASNGSTSRARPHHRGHLWLVIVVSRPSVVARHNDHVGCTMLPSPSEALQRWQAGEYDT